MSEYLLRFPLCAAAHTLLLGVAVILASFAGFAPAAEAEIRSLKLYNNHTGEHATITFKRNGRYIQSGLRELNQFLRDWRRNESTNMDPKLFDLVWEVYQKSGSHGEIHVVSGYRSPATNNMLRKCSRGVAKKSQHMRGKAMDFFILDANLAKLRAIGLRMQVGGVGYYPTSGSPFVHMDTGNVRHWPRMTRSQLACVFPNGKTIHIPSDGKPMPGYKQALAELQARGSRTRQVASAAPERSFRTTGQVATNVTTSPSIRPSLAGVNVGGGNTSGKTLIASLFGGRPRPPADVGGEENTTPQPVWVDRASDDPLPGVSSARVTPHAKPGGVVEVAEPEPEESLEEESEVEAEADESFIVATLPSSKPRRTGPAPSDAIGAIDSVVDPGSPVAEEGGRIRR